MGCVWSNEEHERCMHCNRKEIDGLKIVNNVCEICIYKSVETPHSIQHSSINGPYFGKFHCKSCNRFWSSRLCWPDKYQFCKRCRIPVYPNHIRKLTSEDINKSNNTVQEHQKELCQMCQQLGYSCSRIHGNRPMKYRQRRM